MELRTVDNNWLYVDVKDYEFILCTNHLHISISQRTSTVLLSKIHHHFQSRMKFV